MQNFSYFCSTRRLIMKVFVVYDGFCRGCEAVFSTKELAEYYIQAQLKTGWGDYHYDEYELDEPIS